MNRFVGLSVRRFSSQQQRVFLVAGGSSGLGEACVRRLVGAGHRVVVGDVNSKSGQALVDGLPSGAAVFAQCDVTDEAQVQAAVEAAQSQLGGFHGAVTCAGIGVAQKVLDRDGQAQPLADFEKVIRVNLLGTFNVNRLAAAALARNEPYSEDGERGVLINTASIAAYDGQVGQAAYASSKSGVVGLTLPLARELARHGVRVATVAPGLFDTPLLAALPDKARTALAQSVPFPKRLGDPDQYAALVEHIIGNPMINGEVIRLDGALRMT